MTQLTRNMLERRVKLGAHLLDRKVNDWASMVDLPTLDMESGGHCILGQTEGGYYEGGHRLKVISEGGVRDRDHDRDHDKAVAHGFNLYQKEWTKKNESMLVELWAFEVARRLVKRP